MNIEKWAKVKKIFYGALELAENERGQFVEAECGTDETLLFEVKSLFDAHHQSDSFIESPALASLTELVEDSVKTSRIGQIIGAYRIEKEIGKGGMGAVYMASRADRQFKKKVAVKLIKRGFDTDEIINRFRHERQILATLEHPFITRLIDGGATDDGLPFLVMDYVQGEALTKYADKNQISIEDRLQIFLQICSAVSYAHQNLIIHRDLKPSNILVSEDGTPKLLDFGIAKLIAVNDSGQTIEKMMTVTQAMTPEYASPEQVSGAPVTTASDIYSLGVILYELLTGYRPFSIKTKRAEEITEIITRTSPTKPSSMCRLQGVKVAMPNPQAVVRHLQGDLDNIVLMAIRKEPERRYSSVEQFAEDIRRYLGGLPVIAQEDTFGYRAAKFVKRNKAGVAAGVGIAFSLIGGLIATSRQAKIAARQRDRARQEARKAEKINQFLQKMLASADPRVVGKDVKVIEVLSLAAESLETDFVNQPEIAVSLETTIGQTYLSLGQIEMAEKYLTAAFEKSRRLFPPNSVEMAVSLTNYGKLLQAKGDFNSAEPLYLEALRILRRSKSDSLEVAEVLNSLGYLLVIKGENETALRLHEEELVIRRAHLGENHAEVAKTLEKLAGVLTIMDKRDVSEPLMRRSLKILKNVHGREHPDVALSMLNLAGTLYPTAPDEAEALCRASLEMRRKLLGEDHADLVWSLYNLAYILIYGRKYAEAEKYVFEALAKRGTNLPDEHPVVGSLILLSGRILMAQEKYPEALTAFEECVALRRKNLPEDHWLFATTRSFIGEALIRLGQPETGRRMMLESYEILSEKLGRSHEQTRQLAERLEILSNEKTS